MPTLPDKFSLGARPAPRAGRQIVSIETGQVARAGAIAGQQLQRTAKELADEAEAEQKLTYAEVRADFEKRKIEILGGIQRDPDFASKYEEAPQRYDAEIKAAQAESAARLGGKYRRIFAAETGPVIERGRDLLDGVVGAKRKDSARATLLDSWDSNLQAAQSAGDGKSATALLSSTGLAIDAAVAKGHFTAQEGAELRRKFVRDYSTGYIKGLPDDEQIRILTNRLKGNDAAGGETGDYGNNVGNLIVSNAQWQGKGAPGGPGGKFETFSTPEAGVAANFKNLRTIADGIGPKATLKDVAAVWAPAPKPGQENDPLLKGNDPAAWANNVAKYSGWRADAPLPLNDPDKMAAIMRGINRQEHGKETVPGEAFAVGVRSVLENKPLPAAQASSGRDRAPLYTVDAQAPGLSEAGNINLLNRPAVKNADGSVSSVRSMSVNIDGKEVLIPTVSEDGKILTDDQAVAQYRKTGKHLGKFDTPENATAYADRLHNQQAALSSGSDVVPSFLSNAEARALLNAAEARKRTKEAEERRERREEQYLAASQAAGVLQDQISAIRTHGTGVMSPEEFSAFMWKADPKTAAARIRLAEDEQNFFAVRKDIALTSRDEDAKALASVAPKVEPDTPAGLHDDAVRRYTLLQKGIQQKWEQINDDPAKYVLGHSQRVADLYAAKPDPDATPAQQQANLQASTITATRALLRAQTEIGVPDHMRRVLPKALAQAKVGEIMALPAEKRADALEQTRRMYGEEFWPYVARDLQGAKLPAELTVVSRLDGALDAVARADLSAAFAVGRDNMEKNFERSTLNDAGKEIDRLYEGLRTAKYAQGGKAAEVFSQERDAAYMLTLWRMNRYGESASTAAKASYDSLVGDKWDFLDSDPVTAPKGKGRDVAAGLAMFRNGLAAKDIEPMAGSRPGLTEDERRNQTLYYAKRGTFIDNETGTGFILRSANNAPVRWADGKRVEVSLEDVLRLAASPPVGSADPYPVSP